MPRKSTSIVVNIFLLAIFIGAQFASAGECPKNEIVVKVTSFLPEGDGFWVYGSNSERGAEIGVCTRNGTSLPVAFKSDESAQDFADLHILSIQAFYGLLVVTQETGSAYLIRLFAYDGRKKVLREMASDGSKFLPSLNYYGVQLQPGIGVIHSEMDSRVSSKPIPKEEVFYYLNESRSEVLAKHRSLRH